MTRKRQYARTRPNTRGRRKYQCTAPAAWGSVFKRAARAVLGSHGTESHGVALALEIGARALADTHGITIAPATAPIIDPDQLALPLTLGPAREPLTPLPRLPRGAE